MTNDPDDTQTPPAADGTDSWTPLAPSSTPFYSTIDSSPVPPPTSYAPAPKAGGGNVFGTEFDETNPYAGTGYDTLGHPSSTPPTGGVPRLESTPPQHGGQVRGQVSGQVSGQAGLSGLYQAENNPYSDRSGRPISAVTPDAGPQPGASYPGMAGSSGPGVTPYSAPVQPPSYLPPQGPPMAYLPTPAGGAPRGKNRGLIFVIVAILGVAAAVVALVIGFGLRGQDGGEPAAVADTDLSPGMCLESMTYSTANELPQVPCSTGHRLEVIENITVQESTFIGDTEMASLATNACAGPLQAVADEYRIDDLEPQSFFPSSSTWEAGDRTITCLIGAPPGQLLFGSYTQGDIEAR